MPREIAIPVSCLTPLQREAWFFATVIEPTNAPARRRLIEAEYTLFDPLLAHNEAEAGGARKLHEKAMRTLERERLLSAVIACAFIKDAAEKKHGFAKKSMGLKVSGSFGKTVI